MLVGTAAWALGALPGAARAQTTVVYVNGSLATGNNSGMSWANAYRGATALHSALSSLPQPQPGSAPPPEIWVASGMYKPSQRSSGSDARSVTFSSSIPVVIRGGFAGNEVSPADRVAATPPTVLSGDLSGNDGPNLLGQTWTGTTENAYHVVSVTSSSATVLLDRLMIAGGSATGTSSLDRQGGGVLVTAGDVTLHRCVCIRNRATDEGGGIYSSSSGSSSSGVVKLLGCRMYGNRGANGGAADGGFTTIDSCVFSGNWADGTAQLGRGGGVYMSAGNAVINACTFTGNLAQAGAAVYEPSGRAAVFGNVSWGNQSTSQTPTTARSMDSLSSNFVNNHIQNFQGIGPGNSAANPLLVDADGPDNQYGTLDDNPSLSAGSPCIDTGFVDLNGEASEVDAAGNRRVADGNGDAARVIDRGAFEFASLPYPYRVHVQASAPAGGDGSSWSGAVRTATQAFDLAAQSAGDVGEVWIASGVYRAAPTGGPGAPGAALVFTPSLRVYGGFAGTETAAGQRNIAANTTLLSGDVLGDDAGGPFTGDNAPLIVDASWTLPSAVLDGVTIGGAGNSSNSPASGLLIAYGAVQVRDCTFLRSPATSARMVAVTGSNQSFPAPAPSPTFTRCSFIGDPTASAPAGAVKVVGPMHPSSPPVLFRSCTFINNTTAVGGAGLRVESSGLAAAVQCTFDNNQVVSTGYGGGAGATSSGVLTLANCLFQRNLAIGGSAIGNSGGVVTASNCLIIGNTSAGVGGSSSTRGAAVWTGGGVTTLANCTVAGNAGSFGFGGVLFEGALSAGSGVYNTILWGNVVPPSLAGQIAAPDAGAGVDVEQCVIEQWVAAAAAHPGITGAADPSDPLLIRVPSPGLDGLWRTGDDDLGDLRVGFHSPCIDAGDNARVPADAFDLDTDGQLTEPAPLDSSGSARFVDDPSTPDTGAGTAPICDIGSIEFQLNCATCPGPRYWRYPAAGNFTDAANWYPGVPDRARDAVFQHGGSPVSTSVFFPALGSTSNQSLTIDQTGPGAFSNSVLFSLGGGRYALTATADTSLVMGSVAAPGASLLRVQSGELAVVGARIGSAAGSSATLLLDTPATSFTASRSTCIGCDGVGALTIVGGAHAITRDATVGDQPGSSGSATVSDPGSRWDIPFFLIVDSGSVQVNSGAVVSTGFGTFLFNDGRIGGDGTVEGPLVNFGQVAPGAASGSANPGTLTVNGGYEQFGAIPAFGTSSGSLRVKIAGPGPGQADRLLVNGPVTLGGGMFVSFAGGFQPSPADSFRVLDAGANPIDKQFDVVFFPALTAAPVAGKFLRAQYSGLRGPGGSGITVNLADLPVNAGFGAAQEVALGNRPLAAALGDLNRDGKLDLAVAFPGTSAGSVVVFFNDGAGNFGSSIQLATDVNPSAIAIANFDGVQGNDLAIANQGSDNVRIIRQQPIPGSFADPSPVVIVLPAGAAPVALAAADLNPTDAVQAIDLVIGNEGAGGAPGTGSVSIARNTGPAPSSPRTTPMPRDRRPRTVRPFNPDQDKDPDVAVACVNSATNAGTVEVLVNVGGNGLYTTGGSNLSLDVGANPVDLAAGPLGPGGAGGVSSGGDDLVTVNMDGQSVSVLRNTTTVDDAPTFAPVVSYTVDSGTPGVSSQPRAVVLTDLDNDGDLDLGVLANTGAAQRVIKLLRNDSTTQTLPGNITIRQVAFAPLADRASGDCPSLLLAGEVNGDGRADLVTVNAGCARDGLGSVAVSRNTLPPLGVSLGACCAPEASGGGCSLVTVGQCGTGGGSFRGVSSPCAPSPCAFASTACCRGSTCAVVATSTLCTGANTRAVGFNTACNAPGNASAPCCRADFNQSGAVSVQDIFDFLGGYFAGGGFADFNQSGGASVQDIFDFLAGYFGGC